jgi:3-oxoacyl-[acyl-carrier-protein] synthase-3
MSYASVIHSVHHYLPENVVTNFDLEKKMDTSDAWITERTGIKERRYAVPGVATSDLAVQAAEGALKKSGYSPKDFDLIIASTMSPDPSFRHSSSM